MFVIMWGTGGGDMSPPLFYPRGAYYVLSPPFFDPDLDFFDKPNSEVACLGRHWVKKRCDTVIFASPG